MARKRKKIVSFLRPNETAAVLTAAQAAADKARGPRRRIAAQRDYLLMLFAFTTGFRCAEITKVRAEDLDLGDEPTATCIEGKNSKDRMVPLLPEVAAKLAAWLNGRRTGWLFPNPRGNRLSSRTVQDLFERMGKAAGLLKRLHPHVARHSYATDLFRNGADATEVARLLGHSSPAVTLTTYLHCDTSRLRGVVGRLSLATPLPPSPLASPPTSPSSGQDA